MIALVFALLFPGNAQDPQLSQDVSPAKTLIAYGVGDLTGAAEIGAPPFGELEPGRELEFIGTGWVAAWREHAERVAEAAARAEELANEIRDYVVPSIGAEDVHVVTPGVIAVSGAADQHASLAKFLVWQRALADSIFVEAEVFTTAADAMAELGFGGQALLSPEGRKPLVQRLLDGGAERTQAPKILLNGQSRTGSILVGDQIAYIRDFNVEHDPRTQTTVADPVIDVVFDGLRLEVRVTPLEGDSLGASIELEVSEVAQPIPTREIQLSPHASPVTIQEPDVRTTSVRTRVKTLDGHTAVLVAPDPGGEGDLVLLITLSRLDVRQAPGTLPPKEGGRRR